MRARAKRPKAEGSDMRWQEAATKMQAAPGPPDPQVVDLPIASILEPALPARAQMSEELLNELKESMQAIGLIQPIAVKARGDFFEVLAGHRRLLAARALAWPRIKARVYPQDHDAAEAVKLHENIVRESLNAAEECIYIQQLFESGCSSEDDLCKALHKSPDYIAERMRLLRGNDRVFEALRQGQITFAVARELNFFDDDPTIHTYLDSAIRSGCAARVVRQWRHEWEIHAGMRAPQPSPPDMVLPAEPVNPFKPSCAFCGGAADPWNLITLYVHKWEFEYMQRLLGKPTDATDKAIAQAEARAEGKPDA